MVVEGVAAAFAVVAEVATGEAVVLGAGVVPTDFGVGTAVVAALAVAAPAPGGWEEVVAPHPATTNAALSVTTATTPWRADCWPGSR